MLSSCSQKQDDGAFEQAFVEVKEKGGYSRAALEHIDSFYSTRTDINPYWLLKKYHFKKNFYYYNNQYDSSNLYVDSQLYILEHNNITEKYISDYAAALNDKGDVYFSQNDLNKAFEYYYKSRTAAQKAKDTCSMGNHSYHLGMVTYRRKKYADAIEFFHQSFAENGRCWQDSVNFFRSQELLNNIALSYTRLHKHDSAMHYYNKAIAYINKHSVKFGEYTRNFSERAKGVIYGNQAKIYAMKGKIAPAEELLKESIDINTKPGYDNRDAQLAQMQLAELYHQHGKSAGLLLQQIRASLDTLPNNEVELRWQQLMYSYKEMKEPASALYYAKNYIRLKDSLDTYNASMQTDVTGLLEHLETKARVSLLAKDNELKLLYLWMVIGFSVLTLLIILLIYNNYRRSRKSIDKLTALNMQVSAQNRQLEFAMQELEKNIRQKKKILRVVAHDLRGPVSGVAYLASRILNNEYIKEEERKSLSIIEQTSTNSMNLIHQLLEQDVETHRENAPTDICELVKLSVNVLQYNATRKKQTLQLNAVQQALYAKVNPAEFSQIINNIIGNAIKFSYEEAVIAVAIVQEGDKILISVQDTGIGIPEDMQEHIFSESDSVKRLGTNNEKSYGMGLAIAGQIMNTYKGKIWFKSAEDVGTTFFITLPIANA